MRSREICVGVACLLFSWPAMAGGDIRLLGGRALYSESVWEPVEKQGVLGLELALSRGASPWRFVGGILWSQQKEHTLTPAPVFTVTFEGKTTELTFGAQRLWRTASAVRPFAGGGIALGTARFTASDDDFEGGREEDRDQYAALFAGGGVRWHFGPGFSLGVEGRISRGTRIGYLDHEGRAGGAQGLIGFGWGWQGQH